MIRYMPLGDVCEQIVDCPHETPEWKAEGIAVIRNFNLVDGRIDMQDGFYVDEETYIKRTRRAVPSEGDIIFSREAPIGNCAIVPHGFKCCLGQRLVLLRVNHQICSSEYLLAVLQSSYVKQQIEQVSKSGSIVSNFAIGDLHKLIIPVLSNQDSIAKISSDFSEKIANNKSICSGLENMAKLLYDYWFVQFDFPDENGKQYKSSGGKMVWNDELKREIPAGWEVNRLGDLISYSRGVSYTGNDMCDSGTPIISLASIDRSGRYIPDGIKYYNQEYPSSKVLKPYDLVMANTDMTQERAVMGKIIFVPDIFKGDILSTHHITKIVIADDLKSYLMMTTQTDWFHKYIKGFSSGTNVLGMDMVGFEDYMLVHPSHDVLMRFDSIVHDCYDKIFEVYRENFELASLRDFLLPMLMNGQITIREAEKHVERIYPRAVAQGMPMVAEPDASEE